MTMAAAATRETSGKAERTSALLGGERVLNRSVRSALEAHAAIVDGLPGDALAHLIHGFDGIRMSESLERALGMSQRTLQRRKKDSSTRRLSPEQSGRTWQFAEILVRAIEVFGTQAEAEAWLERPALGLDQQRPIDLLASPAGVRLVEQFLDRLDAGVYA